MSSTVAQKITRARTQLLFTQPFFGSLALMLRLREVPADDPVIQTMAVDGKYMFYNPKFVEKLSEAELIGVIAHEVLHCAFQHMTRRQARNPGLWNVAGDYAINAVLKQANFTLPKEALMDLTGEFKDMSSEEIYSKLLSNARFVKDLAPGIDPGGCGGVLDSEGSNQGQTQDQETEREWKQNVAQAATAARSMGKLPAGLDRLVDSLVHTTTPWRDILRRWLTEQSKSEHRWSPPNRRFTARGMYLPAIVNEVNGMGEIVVAIDTSGSIDDRLLRMFGSELNTIRKEARPKKTHVIWIDAAVHGHEEYGPEEELELKPKGGGGTDFRPAFKWQENNAPQAVALIYLTDMYGTFPDAEDVRVPTLWVTMTKDCDAPFGEMVAIDEIDDQV